jgi:sugar phosphate isomerase/epimerase
MSTPTLHILQSIWGMDRVRGNAAEWSISERMALIHSAGFAGFSAHVYPGAGVEQWMDEARDYGFVIEGNAFPKTVEDLRPALELAAQHQIHHLVVQGDVRPYNAQQAVAILQGWQELAREYGVPVLLETHRNTISNDLWVMREMLDLVPGLPLLADLSHYVCGQEMQLPITPRNQELIERVLSHAQAFHGRVASSEQIQLEIGFDGHQPWVAQFRRWWEWGFADWLDRAAASDSLTFTCELGPSPYAITERDGQDRSDRWEDAQRLRGWVQQSWTQVLAARAADKTGGAPGGGEPV